MESPNRNQGVSTDGAAQTEDPIALGSKYSADATLLDVLHDNDKGALLIDILRNLKVTLGTKLAGEDLDADVLNVADGATYLAVSAAAATVVKSGSGILYDIIVTKCLDASTLTVYDNTSAAVPYILKTFSTAVADFGVAPASIMSKSCKFNTGLTIVSVGNVEFTVLYR